MNAPTLDPQSPVLPSLQKAADGSYIYRYYLVVDEAGRLAHHIHRLTQQEVADHVHDLFEYVRKRDEE